MSEQTIKAIYQDGVFRPIDKTPIHYHEDQEVELEVNESPEERVERILDLLAHFYDGLSEEEINNIEQAMRRRPNFFGEEEAEETSIDSNRAT